MANGTNIATSEIRDAEHSTSTWMNFVVVRSRSPYNGIIGRLGVRKIQAVPSIAHAMLKFPVPGGILTLRSSKIIPLECTMVSGPKNPFVDIPLNVLDAYKGYHQIKMANEDEEKTTFITSQGIFCDSKMPFGLKNVGATYQRLVDKSFQKQIGRNLEVYIDDLVIKSRTEQEIIRDIEETFKTQRERNMTLNPKKYTFGMEECMFMGYKVNTKGIKVCPDKVEAVLGLPSLKCLKDVQRLNGKLASPNRFLAKSAEKPLPFFKTLKKCIKKSDFQWIAEAEAAFKQMKKLIAKLPTPAVPMEKDELIVYLATSREAVNAVLMTGREAKQMPIYFVICALQGPEINYKPMEKLVLALVHASKRLKRYFQEHPIIVITDQPIKQVLSKPKIAERLQKWSIKLGEYDISYRPRVSIKGQILADFIVEQPEDDSLAAPMEIKEELRDPWTLFTDGSSCIDGSGAGLILTGLEGKEFTYALRFRFDATNNEAEYEALIVGLKIAEQMGVKNLQTHVESRLVANQINGSYIAKESGMVQYLEKVKTLISSFRKFLIKQVSRSKNKKADALKALLAERKKARAVRLKSRRYVVINGVLYKKSFLEPWLRALPPPSIRKPTTWWKEKTEVLGEGVNARLDKGSKDWIEEISHVLWAHRTMIKSSNGDTPFSLTYETEEASGNWHAYPPDHRDRHGTK
ncbi:reverse transcriptase domain-containing protein [Tanacetum coccineum]